MTKLDYEKARRTRKGDYAMSPDFDSRTHWKPRPVKYEARCAICGGPVIAGSTATSAMVKGKWYFTHTPCYRRKQEKTRA